MNLKFQRRHRNITSLAIAIRSCRYSVNKLSWFCITGNWWAVSNFGEITGTIAIEMDKGAYIHALDNGLFTLGAPHKGLFQEI